ncbi:hypothetical protein GETHLI_05560 [Geothrix limicola]|uniref:AntA/AntB antirepressor domain-containing protein n=1 Tax=Geothrix limicola TaxID=2927978 RepID=A0ABQ5QB47_9BACT|nr:antA/AntB antirepressor family protein [Geothrix limicola]GLH72054.1 hypothetical protein GETHLI_05560 [Geothrix limicola]
MRRASSKLIPIQKAQLGGSEVNAVSGRDLHAFLEVGKDFTTWIKDHVEAFSFIEGQDFEVFTENGENPKGGRPAKEYMTSISMAKELAMVQRTAKGKQARLYFIECERRATGKQTSKHLNRWLHAGECKYWSMGYTSHPHSGRKGAA